MSTLRTVPDNSNIYSCFNLGIKFLDPFFIVADLRRALIQQAGDLFTIVNKGIVIINSIMHRIHCSGHW